MDSQMTIQRSNPEPLTLTENKLVGYAAVFNSESNLISERGTSFIEVIRPNAFTKALMARDIKLKLNHKDTLGRTKSGSLKLWQDTKGLAFEWTIPDTTIARDVRTLCRNGDLFGCSFATDYTQIKDGWKYNGKTKLHEISEINRLDDVSIVEDAAYESTGFLLRSLEKDLHKYHLAILKMKLASLDKS